MSRLFDTEVKIAYSASLDEFSVACGCPLNDAVFLELHFLANALHVAEDVFGVLNREITVAHERSVDSLCGHTKQLNALVCPDANHVEQSILNMAAEDVAGHELCGRHILQRCLREDFAKHLSLRQFQQEAVFQRRVHFKGVTQTHLLFGETCQKSKLFVDEVGGKHCVSLLYSVGGGEVVVLAGVDDNACIAVYYAAHELVNKRALHIDVAEQDTVESIVEHHVKTLKGTHSGYFGHTETRAIVAKADVAANLFANLVKSFAHDAEVFLRGESAAEALCGGAVRHIVKQALTRCADNGDDVGTLTCGCLSLYYVLIDIAGGNDYIEIGFRALAYGVEVILFLGAAVFDAFQRCLNVRFECLGHLFAAVSRQLGDVELPLCHLLGYGLRFETGFNNGIAKKVHYAFAQHPFFFQRIDQHVGQRHFVGIYAVNAQQAAQGALNGHRAVAFHKVLHIVGNAAGNLFGVLYLLKI